MDVYDPNDPDLKYLKLKLDQLKDELGFEQIDEVAEAFVRVSGRVHKIKDYFSNSSIGWSEIEDLALAKPEESPEFQILLAEKGWQEIAKRRSFLKATPKLQEISN